MSWSRCTSTRQDRSAASDPVAAGLSGPVDCTPEDWGGYGIRGGVPHEIGSVPREVDPFEKHRIDCNSFGVSTRLA